MKQKRKALKNNTMRTKLIGLVGRAGAGKTTAAGFLSQQGYTVRSFATPIKHIAAQQFHWNGEKDSRGRKLLQEIGMAGRAYSRDLWIGKLSADRGFNESTVIDDVRFMNEATYIRAQGGILIKIEGRGQLLDHESETQLEGICCDAVVQNDDLLMRFEQRVLAAVATVEREMRK